MTFTTQITLPNNSAARCRELLIIFEQNKNSRLDNVYALAIGLNNYSEQDIDARETIQMAAFEFRRELLNLIAQIENLNIVPKELYKCLIQAGSELGHLSITTHTPAHGSFLTDKQTQMALGWASCVIATNNSPIDYNELGILLNELLELKKTMRTNALPAETRILFDRLIESIEKNLVKAQITGTHSLERVLRETKHDLHEAADILKKESANLNDSQKGTLSEIAGTLENVGKIFTSVKELGQVVSPYVPAAIQMAAKVFN